ncbi:hypothetical protein COU17_01865 [Candidatus Kaiserbacteria bacterium CG10_big_fil_rev_8_21_14_0_10_49_17]|uniref:Uncharacterized protein n=1 Tax=Candidatus Kaiserbacteria bacterium CG10_big_fil_rev_8_21_14_0_10_49_17 TaxID=1974609 RepID=A0A2M6WEE1_9BACT|nr:MAG: hypothetical protein COU17_01865 [Candidatus Kaiserbacteria bacterium CG10_big_fil_rev_8_21_14_0_10_49_17]
MHKPDVIIYTDGGARNNPEPRPEVSLETLGFPTFASLTAFLHGETRVSPTSFQRLGIIQVG